MSVDRPRRWLDTLTAWSPVLLLGALAGLTFWLDAQVGAPLTQRSPTLRHEPDMTIESFRAMNLGPGGQPLQVLAAERAEHFPDDQTTDFTRPELVMTEPGKPKFTVTSERATLSGDRENVFFAGTVRAVRDAPPGKASDGGPSGPVTLTTEYLHVVPRKDYVVTDKAVTIEEPRGIIRGVGLELDNAARTFKLQSEVRGTLQPRPIPTK
jgi:lipopolysaccharide export system protein LptC